ncbi:serpentine type 7TM GPCR receptor class ab chemoreceptor domain-containing protein [Ditylenchus destructor]|uniref:Serpentine type 7TM GPCR receptor class ab chemoreceptor domain-containing protein n=1 Tax=Ditylenchus destructor TaxID=166010 RepID=A0AAD4MVJ1_9BILA|nr:serpentine type 7TM GPCR receptor class ab chemoreceptor domain-containing protein [Ditylenchus destructor]
MSALAQSQELCQNAEILASSFVYKALLLAKFLSNVFTLVIFLYLVLVKPSIRIFHPNTKMIATFVCAFTVLVSLCACPIYAFELWRVSYPYSNPCDRLLTSAYVFSIRSIVTILSNGINSSLVVLCIERLICICRISNYEQSAKPNLIFSALFILLYLPAVKWFELLAVTTVKTPKNAISYDLMTYYLKGIQYLGAFFFLFIHYWSRWYRRRIRASIPVENRRSLAPVPLNKPLSVKFQIEETVQMTNLFLPVVLLRGALLVISSILSSVSSSIWPSPSPALQMIIYESVATSSITPFFTALLLAHGTGQLRRMFCCSAKRQAKIFVGVNENQDEHFIRLKQMFDGPPESVINPKSRPTFKYRISLNITPGS